MQRMKAGSLRYIWVVEHRSTKGYALLFSTAISFLIFVQAAGDSKSIICPIRSLYQFGDSISDTGNLIRIIPFGPTSPAGRSPFGITFPGNPTGRWSDGRLIIDFIEANVTYSNYISEDLKLVPPPSRAEALGLPLLNPWLDKSASFDNGVNFAVAGSTTLNFSFYKSKGIITRPVPSLRAQLQWFRRHLSSICSTATECADKLSNALFFVGETGYNDVGNAYRQGRSNEEIKSYSPKVVKTIINTTREVIMAGASQVVVPGNFPLGCFPFALSLANKTNSSEYDELGCLKGLNGVTEYQNNLLQQALNTLRNEFPNVVILYADFSNAFLSVLREAPSLGFDATILFKACCGVEGQYSALSRGFCGNPGVPVCSNPSIFLHWDGIHLTQEAYNRMSGILIKDLGIKCSKA